CVAPPRTCSTPSDPSVASRATAKSHCSSRPGTATPIPKPLGTPNLLAPPPSVHHRSSPKFHETREYALQFDGALKPVPFRVIPKILPVWVMPNAGHSALYP